MIITATCPKCRLTRTIELEGEFDPELADVLTRFASHTVCDACASVNNCLHPKPKPQRTVRLPYSDPD